MINSVLLPLRNWLLRNNFKDKVTLTLPKHIYMKLDAELSETSIYTGIVDQERYREGYPERMTFCEQIVITKGEV